jgi:hypothetical protein
MGFSCRDWVQFASKLTLALGGFVRLGPSIVNKDFYATALIQPAPAYPSILQCQGQCSVTNKCTFNEAFFVSIVQQKTVEGWTHERKSSKQIGKPVNPQYSVEINVNSQSGTR